MPFGLNFGTRKSVPNYCIDYRCSIRTRDGERCSFKIYASKNDDGLFEIKAINKTHTCRERDRRLPVLTSLFHPRSKIALLKREIRAIEEKKVNHEKDSEEENWIPMDDESEEETLINSRRPLLRSQVERNDKDKERRSSRRRERSTEEETTDGKEDSDWTTEEHRSSNGEGTLETRKQSLKQSRRTLAAPSSDVRLLYPSSRDVSIDVRRLVSVSFSLFVTYNSEIVADYDC